MIMRATILRIEHNPEKTLGVLVLEGKVFCWTLELPWRRNRQDISCIPEGFYMAKKVQTEKHGKSYLVLHVPDRSEILVGHIGNTHVDTEGCILFGSYPSYWEGRRSVMASEKAVTAFHEATQGEDYLSLGIWSARP